MNVLPSLLALDLARLTCCFKSTSIECREECINYHLHPTPSLREGFRTNCLHSAKEIILYSCFEDGECCVLVTKEGCMRGVRVCGWGGWECNGCAKH